MHSIAERARQALGVGRDNFVPSSLEPQHKTLEELSVFAAPLRNFLSSTEQFTDDTTDFLTSTCQFMSVTPFPRLWSQTSPLSHAEAMQTAVPVQHAAWYDMETHQALTDNATAAVRQTMQKEIISPIRQWLMAYDVIKTALHKLESKRLAYDAERRQLAAAAHKTLAAAAAEGQEFSAGGGSSVSGVEMAQLQEDAAAASPDLFEFECDVEAVDDGLMWLVAAAARIKALLADTAGGLAAAAAAWQVPEGLLPELTPSIIGKGYQVTMTLAEAPLGVETLLGPEVPPEATTGTPDVVALRRGSLDAAVSSSGSLSSDEVDPDQKGLPSDDMIYGGGVAPAAAAHPAAGGGVGEFIKDTLLGPGDTEGTSGDTAAGSAAAGSSVTAAGAARDAAGIPRNPDLSDQLPSDEAMVYGGGVAPTPAAHKPQGGGAVDLIRATVAGDDHHDGGDRRSEDQSSPAAAAAAGGNNGGGVFGRIRNTVSKLVSAVAADIDHDDHDGDDDGSSSSDDGGDHVRSGGDQDHVDLDLISDRPSRSYSGEGVGQIECRSSAAAAAGLGSTGRGLRKALSGEQQQSLPQMTEDKEVVDAEHKQLSTVVLPTSPTAAAAGGSTQTPSFVDNSSPQGLRGANDAVAAAAGGGIESHRVDDEDDGSSKDDDQIKKDHHRRGGLFAAIRSTLEGGRALLTGQQQQQQQSDESDVEQDEQREEENDEAGSDLHVEEEQGKNEQHEEEEDEEIRSDHHDEDHQQQQDDDDGDELEDTIKDTKEVAAAAAATAAADEDGDHHDGAAVIDRSADAEAGWRVEVQGAAESGAPGAPGTPESIQDSQDPHVNPPAAAEAGNADGMHLGPVSPYPGHKASPGSAEFIKGPTTPGGAAAAAAAPAGSRDHFSDNGSQASTPTAAAASPRSNAGPDLSKILPNYEQLPSGRVSKPSGGGVGSFIRDTLLGPPSS